MNEAFVRRFLPGKEPIGSDAGSRLTIIGVAADAVYRTSQRIPGVTSLVLREPIPPAIYAPVAQLGTWDRPPTTSIRISVRTAIGQAGTQAASIGAALSAVDPALELTLRPLADDVRASLSQERMFAGISIGFGALSLFLATLGVYGMTSYSVTRRHTEIGVRVAVGGTGRDITRLILAGAGTLIVPGIAIGFLCAAWLTRLLSDMLFGVTPLDPVTFVSLSVLMAVVGGLAAWIPARRAARANPLALLRAE